MIFVTLSRYGDGEWKTLTLPSPAKRARVYVQHEPKSPRPFRWERARVRAVSFGVSKRKLTNRFAVKPAYFKKLCLRRKARTSPSKVAGSSRQQAWPAPAMT